MKTELEFKTAQKFKG